MDKVLWVIFLACLVSGCGTVTGLDSVGSFDRIKAADARIALGLAYLDVGNKLKAKENLELAIKYAPNYYRSLNSIAYYYQLVGESNLADQAFRKALRESPGNSELLNNYGVFLCKLGEYQQADEYFNRAVGQAHSSPHNTIRQDRYQPGRYQQADSYENAAICSLNSGNRGRAEYYFERSLDYDPSRYLSSVQLARLMIERGDYDGARVRLVEFHQMFGYQTGSLSLLVELEEKAGNDTLVADYSKKLRKLYPGTTK